MKVKCQFHKNTEIFPIMIHFGTSPLGNRQYVCARCARIREFGHGKITYIFKNYGYINNGKRDIFFHFNNINKKLQPSVEMPVKFEIRFKDNGFEAINVTQTN